MDTGGGGGRQCLGRIFLGYLKSKMYNDKKILLLVNIILKKWIWDGKLRGVLPNLVGAKKTIVDNLMVISRISRKIKQHIALGTIKKNIRELQ
jgi:hypothetical protein